MSPDEPQNPDDPTAGPPPTMAEAMKSEFSSGTEGVKLKPLFLPEEMDIYVNKVTLDSYIFHGKEIDYNSLERLEYDPMDNRVTVVYKDGTTQDLGVKIQWLVRSYFTKSKHINVVQTKDGETIDGCVVPLVHKVKD